MMWVLHPFQVKKSQRD